MLVIIMLMTPLFKASAYNQQLLTVSQISQTPAAHCRAPSFEHIGLTLQMLDKAAGTFGPVEGKTMVKLCLDIRKHKCY